MNCRHCESELEHVFLDLGFAPPSNAYLGTEDLKRPEVYFPLRLFVCTKCWLAQTEDYAAADELFTNSYAYFSSVSQAWLDHAAHYCEMITKRLKLDNNNLVIEIASNDGYLLKNFVKSGIPCIGIEPTACTADAAREKGISVMQEFFGLNVANRLKSEGNEADLIIGNNVYAHVPDINNFTYALKTALKKGGTITLEFPHLMQLLTQKQFDTVYHEHFSYLSLFTVMRIFQAAGLRIFDVEELPTHGGSLRVYGCHEEDIRAETRMVQIILEKEQSLGLQELDTYLRFQGEAEKAKNGLLIFLIEQKRLNRKVAAYGAAAKGNTLLNFAGIKPDLLPYVCDAAPSKQGKFLPGSHIPVLPPSVLSEEKPDVIIILPWNIEAEVIQQHGYAREWGAVFMIAVPELRIVDTSI